MQSQFWCAFCFQENPVWVDLSGGSEQRYVEDCQVCCRPNRLTVWIRESDGFGEDEAEDPVRASQDTLDNFEDAEREVISDVAIEIESEPGQ